MDSVEGKLVAAPRDFRDQISLAIKYLDVIVRLVKAYKARLSS